MEILAISHKYPPSIGGMQKQSYELVRGLEKRHRVHTIIFKSGYPKVFFILFAWFRAWLKCLATPEIRVIHANDGLMAFFLSPLVLLTDRKLAVTIHGLDVVFPLGLYQQWVRSVLSRFDLIITVSNETRHECIQRGIPSSKVVFVPNGFEPSANSTLPLDLDDVSRILNKNLTGKKILLSVGRPVTRKGFSWFIRNVLPSLSEDCLYIISGPKEKNKGLIRMLRHLPSDLSQKLVLLLGLGVDEQEIDQALKDPQVAGRIFYPGKTDALVLASLRQHACLFVMPNIKVPGDFEGFGLVALEAASAGTLCLAVAIDGIPSAIKHQQNGLLLASGDAQLWIRTITKLLNNPAEINEMANRFQQNLDQHFYTWDMMCARYTELFLKISNS